MWVAAQTWRVGGPLGTWGRDVCYRCSVCPGGRPPAEASLAERNGSHGLAPSMRGQWGVQVEGRACQAVLVTPTCVSWRFWACDSGLNECSVFTGKDWW